MITCQEYYIDTLLFEICSLLFRNRERRDLTLWKVFFPQVEKDTVCPRSGFQKRHSSHILSLSSQRHTPANTRGNTSLLSQLRGLNILTRKIPLLCSPPFHQFYTLWHQTDRFQGFLTRLHKEDMTSKQTQRSLVSCAQRSANYINNSTMFTLQLWLRQASQMLAAASFASLRLFVCNRKLYVF